MSGAGARPYIVVIRRTDFGPPPDSAARGTAEWEESVFAYTARDAAFQALLMYGGYDPERTAFRVIGVRPSEEQERTVPCVPHELLEKP